MNVKVGCSGFQEARSKYYNEFQLVEVQQTFFQPPPIGTAFKWRNQSPRDFEFTVKAWQIITHESTSPSYQNLREKLPARALAGCGFFKPTRMVMEAWQRTEAVAEALGARVIVFQTAKDFRQTPLNISNFKNFFRRINRKKYYLVWEPGDKWHPDTIRDLCGELNLIYTSDPLRPNSVSFGPIQHFRLRGKAGFRSRYTEEDFAKLFAAVRDTRATYFILNNASMLFDARNFQKYVQEHLITIPTISTEPVKLSPAVPTADLDQFNLAETGTILELRPANEPFDLTAATNEDLNLTDFSKENGVLESTDELVPLEALSDDENRANGEAEIDVPEPAAVSDPALTENANGVETIPQPSLTENTSSADTCVATEITPDTPPATTSAPATETSPPESVPESTATTSGTTPATIVSEAVKSDEKSETTTESSTPDETVTLPETSK